MGWLTCKNYAGAGSEEILSLREGLARYLEENYRPIAQSASDAAAPQQPTGSALIHDRKETAEGLMGAAMTHDRRETAAGLTGAAMTHASADAAKRRPAAGFAGFGIRKRKGRMDAASCAEELSYEKAEACNEAEADAQPLSHETPALSGSAEPKAEPALPSGKSKRSLKDVVEQLAESWQECLLRVIDERGFSDTEVYKRAGLDRKLFSKIRSNAAYRPKKMTAVALALALELTLDETKDMLARAGYALSPSSRFDLIVAYFIESDVHNIDIINEALYDHGEPLLGMGA